MKKILVLILAAGFISLLSVVGCKPEPSLTVALPDSSLLISFGIPINWPQPSYSFQDNMLTQQKFELGRKLFYEVRLSRDNTQSCGSCHAQFAAFSHLDHSLSHGIDGSFGLRNAPGLFNLAWKPAYFWDGGVTNLENQPQNPIENPVEMDLPLSEAVSRLNSDANYKKLFGEAFGAQTITSQMMFKALAQFMGTMVSSNSRYDKHIRGEQGGEFNAQEIQGLSLFRDKCATCHKEPLFTDHSYRNNGLAPDPYLLDSGRAAITASPDDRFKFMVPSLRNVTLTRPYMHDGRFTTLDAVLEHYRTGIVISTTLDPALTGSIQMTDQQKEDLIAFLKTLADETFVRDKRFAEYR